MRIGTSIIASACIAAFSAFLGVFSATYLELAPHLVSLSLLGSGLALLCLWVLGRTRPRLRQILVLSGLGMLIFAAAHHQSRATETYFIPTELENQRQWLHVEVTSGCRPAALPCSFEAEVSVSPPTAEMASAQAPRTFRVRSYLSTGQWVPLPGDQARVEGRLRTARPALHPYSFDSLRWSQRQKIDGQLLIDSEVLHLGTVPHPLRSIDARRARIEHAIQRHQRPDPAGILIAMLTGTKSGLSDDIRARFTAAGTGHVLAVSGLHLGLLAAALWTVLQRLFSLFPSLLRRANSEAWCAFVSIPCLLLYVGFTGFPTSAMRAGFMATSVLLPKVFSRRSSGLHSLAFAVLLLLATDPLLITDLGFQLSVVATLSLVILANSSKKNSAAENDPDDAASDEDSDTPSLPISDDTRPSEPNDLQLLVGLTTSQSTDDEPRWKRLLRSLWSATEVSIVSTVATAPFLVWHFGGLPLLSPLPNLLIVPPLSIVALPLVAVGAALDPWIPWLGGVLVWLSLTTVDACLWLARIGAPLFEIEVIFGRPHLLGVVGWAFFAFTAPSICRAPRRGIWASAVIGITLVSIDVWQRQPPRNTLEIHAIPVGQGDATWIRFPDGRSMLIDGGGHGFGESKTGMRYIVPYLRAHGAQHVDILVASHGDADHIAGLVELIPNLQPEVLWVGNHNLKRPLEQALYLQAKALDVPYLQPHFLWERVDIGEVGLEILAVDRLESSNDGGLSFRLCYRDFCALFTGDNEKDREAFFVRHGLHLRAQYLKLGHHGSKTSTTMPFLRAVQPDVAVAHLGYQNRFGFPHPDVLASLRAEEVRLWRTDASESVVHRSDGQRLWRVRHHQILKGRSKTTAR